MGKERNQFSVLDMDEFSGIIEGYQECFPFFDQIVQNLWYYWDISVPRAAILESKNSFEAMVPTDCDRNYGTLSMGTFWEPSKLDPKGYLGLGRRTTHLRLLPGNFFAEINYRNELLKTNQPPFAFMPIDGAFIVEDFRFIRSDVSFREGLLELPRVLPPEHHALLFILNNGRITDLVGDSQTHNLEVITDRSSVMTQFNLHLNRKLRRKSGQKSTIHSG